MKRSETRKRKKGKRRGRGRRRTRTRTRYIIRREDKNKSRLNDIKQKNK